MSHLPRQLIYEAIVKSASPLVESMAPVGSAVFEEQLQPDSVDLRAGVIIAGGLERVQAAIDAPYQLPPGEMAIVITEETVNLPANLSGEVSPRLSVLNDGLLVLAAPHVDPGYSGPLSARVVNLLDRPYRLAFGDLILTLRFCELKIATDRPIAVQVPRQARVQKAIRESRDTFHRLFLRDEDIVPRKELQSAATIQALQWLALLAPAALAVLPFSVPFFWNFGNDLLGKHPWLVEPVVITVSVFLTPLVILYVVLIVRLCRLSWRGR